MNQRPQQLVQKIANDFDLGKIRRWRRIPNSFVNEKYVLTTAKGEFLASSSIRTLRQIDDEIALLNHLRGLPVPALVLSRTKQYRQNYNGKPFIVYRYLKGYAPRSITPLLMRQLGSFQAQFHQRGAHFRNIMNKEPFTYEFPSTKLQKFNRLFLRSMLPEFRPHYPLVYNIVRQAKRFRSLPRGPIHVDIKPDNVLVQREKLTGVIDFGNCYRGPLLVDIAKTLVWFSLRKDTIDAKLLRSFLTEYERIRPLTQREKTLLPFALRFAAASHIFIDYYTYIHHIVPLSYLRLLHKKFMPFLLQQHKTTASH